MRKHTLVYLAAGFIAFSISATSQVLAQTATYQESTYHEYDPGCVPRTTVLDSWMEPTVLRTREVTNASGEKQSIAEPLVMERHERVIVPQERVTTTSTNIRNSSYSASESSSDSYARPIHHHIVRRHYAPVAYAAPRHYTHRIAYRSNPVSETKEQVVERSVVLERRDPALNWY